MVKKIILITCIMLFINACSQNRVKTKYQDVIVPINVVPEPPRITQPILEVNTLSEKDKLDDGELLKAYKITTHQLLDFSKILLTIYKEYLALSKESKNLFDILEKYNTNQEPSQLVVGVTDTQINPPIIKNVNFDIIQDYKLWKTSKRFKELQETINKLESTNYITEE